MQDRIITEGQLKDPSKNVGKLIYFGMAVTN
jgi:hypothetical protein